MPKHFPFKYFTSLDVECCWFFECSNVAACPDTPNKLILLWKDLRNFKSWEESVLVITDCLHSWIFCWWEKRDCCAFHCVYTWPYPLQQCYWDYFWSAWLEKSFVNDGKTLTILLGRISFHQTCTGMEKQYISTTHIAWVQQISPWTRTAVLYC